MAFRRTANALLTNKNLHLEQWMEELRRPVEGTHLHSRVASTIKKIKVDPKQYLLSHATIVASVDTIEPKNVKIGRRVNRGCEIDVRYSDFRIKPETYKFVNNNSDCWSRPIILSTYRTFVGASNFLEHLQIVELSKGFIADAIARDLGDTVYIDILVATERKHKKLVSDILSGDINSLSMGTICQFTICSKCGNVAVDDSQSCACILAGEKGSKFITEDGEEHPTCELLGHVSVPNSNQFIEASWVKNPAFVGAVSRTILNPESNSVLAGKLNEAAKIYEIKLNVPEIEGLKKAASVRRRAEDEAPPADAPEEPKEEAPADDAPPDFDAGDEKAEEPKSEEPKAESGGSDKLDELINDLETSVIEGLSKRIKERLGPKPEDVGYTGDQNYGLTTYQDNLINGFDQKLLKTFPKNLKIRTWASKTVRIVQGGPKAVVAAKLTSRDLIKLAWVQDRLNGQEASSELYKISMKLGPSKLFPSEQAYLATAQIKLGRVLSNQDKKVLVRHGRVANAALSNC